MKSSLYLLWIELVLVVRQGFDALLIVGFFVLVSVLFVLGVGPEPRMLGVIAPGIVWTACLLAALLSLDRLFQVDWESGALDNLCLASAPLEGLVLAKALSHWAVSGLPVLCLSPIICEMLQIPAPARSTLIVSLALGTPTISLIGTVCAALALGARRGGMLLAILVLPLTAPILIFGAGSAEAAITGHSAKALLLFLTSILCLALCLTPIAASAAVRLAISSR